MYGKIKEHLCTSLENLKKAGLYKDERSLRAHRAQLLKLMVRKYSTSVPTTILACLIIHALLRVLRR